MNVNQKRIALIGAGLVILASLLFFVTTNNANDSSTRSEANTASEQTDQTSQFISNADGTVVSYYGVNGKTALDLLKQYSDTETKDSSLGEYVISINGAQQTDDTFWLFYVNNEAAQVGAGDYQTKTGDVIEWRLE